MTRIELGSPSISQKKHIIGYWVSDDENVKLDCSSIDNARNTKLWFETGTYYGKYFNMQITEIHIPPYTRFEYYLITGTEFDTFEYGITSDRELNEFDLRLRFADDEHTIKVHRTK